MTCLLCNGNREIFSRERFPRMIVSCRRCEGSGVEPQGDDTAANFNASILALLLTTAPAEAAQEATA